MKSLYVHEGINYMIVDECDQKTVWASDGAYHSKFDRKTGFFARWGQNFEDDPLWCPIGPEILDLEISVNGCPNNCRFCYKGNTNAPAENMTFETFKAIFDKMPKTLTQIAFGITGVQTNPDFFRMMEYCREHGVVPNFTMSGIDLTPELADRIAKLAGAVAVSVYQTDKNVGYDAIKMLTDRGMKQVNIHLFTSEETLGFVKEVVEDRMSDPRLEQMRAIVLLGVKPKGRAKGRYTTLSQDKFCKLVKDCLGKNIPIGFDSCSAPKFEQFVNTDTTLSDKEREAYRMACESCESGLFSSYINQKGEFFPCSFCEGEAGWETGLSVLTADSFLDVWHGSKVQDWRGQLLASSCNGCRRCMAFPEINV